MTERATRHPVTVKMDFDDHRAMAEHWARELLWAIQQAVANPHPTTIEDLDMNHAVRSARYYHWHASKVVRNA